MDGEYLRLYEVFEKAVGGIGEDEKRHHVVFYHPDMYVDMAKEILQLKRENERVKDIELKYISEVQMNINLLDKLRWCEETLNACGVRLPFRCDGSPK